MSLARVDFSDFPAIISTIERDGGVILTNFTTPETLTNVNAETLPWLNADKPWQGALFPPETRRCTRLIGRSPTVRTAWFEDDQLYRIISHFLAKTTWNFFDGERHVNTTYPVLSTALTMDVRPGAKGQRLHRDDKNHHVAHRDMMATGYLAESDVEMAVLVPGVEVDRENGATAVSFRLFSSPSCPSSACSLPPLRLLLDVSKRYHIEQRAEINANHSQVIPGSHLWGDERAPRIEEAVYASMHPGEALLFLGSTYHAGGTNSTADRTRPMHGLFYCRGTLRGEVCRRFPSPP